MGTKNDEIRQLKAKLAEVEAERDRLKTERDYLKGVVSEGPHILGAGEHGPDECPTYYDGCNCTVGCLEHNIRRAEDAESRLAESQAREAQAGLGFSTLRRTNVHRCESAFHALDRWSPLEWCAAVAGEMGEACNAVKKLWRLDHQGWIKHPGDADDPTARAALVADIGEEIADTVIYLDLLAARLGIDLGTAVTDKFNKVSERVGSAVRIEAAPASEALDAIRRVPHLALAPFAESWVWKPVDLPSEHHDAAECEREGGQCALARIFSEVPR